MTVEKPLSAFAGMTAWEMLEGYRLRRFSPVDVIRETYQRIERLNPLLNAFYLLDEEGAVGAARASEDRWQRGAPLGLLDGIPTSIKDSLPWRGTPSYRGSAASVPETSAVDAPAVARLREAGAIFLGKTTMPDFGILPSGLSSKHGITRNPWNTKHTPGGSSSGAAASIAAGLNPVAIGTDIVGSIRVPASFCGIFGFKPSQGRVPYYFPNSPSLVAGPMARTVDDAVLLMAVIAAPDARDFTALPADGVDYRTLVTGEVSGARIGVIGDLGFGIPDPQVPAKVEGAARLLEREGCRTTPVSAPFNDDDLRQAERFYKVRCRTELNSCPSDRRDQATIISAWSAEAERLSAVEFYGIFNALQRLRERALHLIDEFDFLIMPTVPQAAFQAELPGFSETRVFEPWANAFLFNLTEQPASSINCGLTATGLPIGLQIVGRRFDDRGVLQLSRACERVLPEAILRPAMPELM
jgi:Asp-tRNA(Asn)/Glu-tRNA(Gln) amidotransferase A subunit family amidase